MLELREVSFEVKEAGSRKKILDHISLKIKNGSFIGITGPNGSGKSTLAEIIMGMKQPSSGRIFLDGQDITDLGITERAKNGVAMAFQRPVKLKGLKVYDLLRIANGELISEEEAGKCLRQVGLEPKKYLFREIDQNLSGGELKRIEILSVLMRKAKLTVFDEPEAGIDLWSFGDLTKILKKMKSEEKIIITISHQEKILKLADQILVLENGKIKTAGKPEKVLPKIMEAKNGA